MASTSDKVEWDNLAPALQARLDNIQASIDQDEKLINNNRANIDTNWANTQTNTESLNALRTYIQDHAKEISDQLEKYNQLPDGTSSGISYAYKNGSFGQVLKVDKKYQRLIPSDNFLRCAIVTNDKCMGRIKKTSAIRENDYIYIPTTKRMYYYQGGNWNVDMNVLKDEDLELRLSRIFTFDYLQTRLYFVFSPTKFVRLL